MIKQSGLSHKTKYTGNYRTIITLEVNIGMGGYKKPNNKSKTCNTVWAV